MGIEGRGIHIQERGVRSEGMEKSTADNYAH